MVYESLDPQIALTIFIIYVILAIFIWILTIFLGIHWYQQKKSPVRSLTHAFFSYASAITILAGGMFEVVKTGLKMEVYIFSLPYGLISTMIGHIFIILFIVKFFGLDPHDKKIWVYIIHAVLISFSLLHPNNNYGVSGDNLRIPDIRLYTSAIMVVFSLFTFTRIAMIISKARKQVDDKYSKIGFRSLAWAQIFMILFYLFYTFDTIAFNLFGWKEFTPLFYIAMVFISFCVLSFYLGILLPDWILHKNLSEYFREILEERMKRSKDSKHPILSSELEKKNRILIQCPICHKSTHFDIPSQFLELMQKTPRGMINISIKKGLLCHTHLLWLWINMARSVVMEKLISIWDFLRIYELYAQCFLQSAMLLNTWT